MMKESSVPKITASELLVVGWRLCTGAEDQFEEESATIARCTQVHESGVFLGGTSQATQYKFVELYSCFHDKQGAGTEVLGG